MQICKCVTPRGAAATRPSLEPLMFSLLSCKLGGNEASVTGMSTNCHFRCDGLLYPVPAFPTWSQVGIMPAIRFLLRSMGCENGEPLYLPGHECYKGIHIYYCITSPILFFMLIVLRSVHVVKDSHILNCQSLAKRETESVEASTNRKDTALHTTLPRDAPLMEGSGVSS